MPAPDVELPWYQRAVIYALDVETFADSDGDGVGDFAGLRGKLDAIVDLGATCVWLTPFYPTPNGDNGYDIRDYLAVDPRLGTLDDFTAFCQDARDRGLRVIVDLVCNHSSVEHPWFQQARSDPGSPYRPYYLWSDRPEPPGEPVVFPGDEPGSIWAYDDRAGAFYRHRFYAFEADLATGDPGVIREIERIIAFWLDHGADGFRIDAAPYYGDRSDGHRVLPGDPHAVLKSMRSFAGQRRSSVALMGETDADPAELAAFFGDGDELHLLLNFFLDNHLFLALAREQAVPIAASLRDLPNKPALGQWANFLRNFDELDLERLGEEEREEVYRAFAPDPHMRVYGRGIRRRLAPMLGGDQRRIALAFSLLLSMPGTPVIYYGDEIGMGDDLSLPERVSVRTPMQWSDAPNGGFSTAAAERLVLPVIDQGPFGYRAVNWERQAADPASLLCQVRRAVQVLRRHPAFSAGSCTVLDTNHASVLAHVTHLDDETVLAVHNLSGQTVEVTVAPPAGVEQVTAILSSAGDAPDLRFGVPLGLEPYGYRWYRADPHSRSSG